MNNGIEDTKKALLEALSDESINLGHIAALTDQLLQMDPDAVRFEVDARHIHRLGFELVGKQETALSELIKNAYDADATRVTIDFSNFSQPGGRLIVADDGHGMAEQVIRDTWMRLSTSDKEDNPVSPGFCRSRAGRKGIGRFAVERLGKQLVLETRVAGATNGTRVSFNWDAAYAHGTALTRIPNRIERFEKLAEESGTTLIINDLRDRWTEKQFDRVWKSVLLLQPPFKVARKHRGSGDESGCQPDPGFEVVINGQTGEQQAEELSLEKNFLAHRAAVISGKIDGEGRATFFVDSEKTDLHDQESDYASYSLIGKLEFEVSYFIYSPDFISNVSARKAQQIGEVYGGIRIYRDGFRVLPYGEPHDDWLRLARDVGRRSILVPANNSNFFGHIDLSSTDNPFFEETSSREGLIENEAYEELQQFVRRCLEWAAKRVASARGRKQTASQKDFIERPRKPSETTQELLEELADTSDMGRAAIAETVQRLEKVKEEQQRFEAEFEASEDEHIRYEEMLRILASLGISIAVFGHEVKGAITHVRGAMSGVEDALKRKELDGDDIKGVLESARIAVDGLSELGGYVVDLVDQSKAKNKKEVALHAAINSFIDHFKAHLDARGVVFEVSVEPPFLRTTPMHRSEIDSVLFNFLTNALKSMDRANSRMRKIRITAQSLDGYAVIGFQDTGGGIADEIRDRVFDAFFTTSYYSADEVAGPGAGLGLKIVYDIAAANGGFARVADPEVGYACKLEFGVPLAHGQRRG
jgi:signal transduction histidine kinase